MNYNTILPSADLDSFVKCYWTLEGPAYPNPEKQRIVPDGCMEMIFHCGDLYEQYFEDGSHIVQPKAFVFGQITKPLEIRQTGKTAIFAIRFHPHGFVPFISVPASTMENRAVPLPELFGAKGEQLEKEILAAATTVERIKLLETFLINCLVNEEAVDRLIKSSIETMLTLNGQMSVAALSKELAINRRQLERKFATLVGLSPKQLAKIFRLQATLKTLLLKGQAPSLTVIAYTGDYFDQAHFIKDFKEFTGVTPKKFYAGNLTMSTLFATFE
ncbi:helix-turn-helix domain-containing protein [Pedobacter sp. Hv1]|uniref:helix-turn-helix domain-containing protein n=1 Tax=Pedobacter sp. Hv1 TaxID=1740090 RepID=UPI0006D8AF14|nr:helix-turn-helix domain-containing protein [Pedobacter sp. Hv1]KQC00014.1 AraC family transcriptional regulator [Pedobacter sp. Hv1]